MEKRGNIDIPNASIHTFSCFWLDACTYITSGTVKLALYDQSSPLSEMIRSCMCFPHVGKIPTLIIININCMV